MPRMASARAAGAGGPEGETTVKRSDRGGTASRPSQDGKPRASRRWTRRELLRAGMGASGLALLAGCAPAAPSRDQAGPAAGPQAQGTSPGRSGGQIVFTSGSEPLTLNPALGTSSDTIYYSQPMFDGLTR